MERLWELVYREGIFVKWAGLRATPERLWGMYYYDPVLRLPVIVLDASLPAKPRLLRCVLAEELGHHFTVPAANSLKIYFSYSDGIARGRDEVKAMKWATDFLIPDEEFKKVAKFHDLFDLAEHFDVTEAFIMWKSRFFRQSWIAYL